MKNTTVTIWVKKSDFAYFLEVFRKIIELPVNYFDYHFRAEDINYSTAPIGTWVQINIPIDDYLKWEICYRTNS